jgi:hypothetical protein
MSFDRIATQEYVCDTTTPPTIASSISTFNFGDTCTSSESLRRFYLVSCSQTYNEDTGYWDATDIVWREISTNTI